jgi:hypothetical protein
VSFALRAPMIFVTLAEGPRRRPERGEWEPIKILLENLTYTQNPT